MTIPEHIEKSQNLANQLTVHLAEAYRLSLSQVADDSTIEKMALIAYLGEMLEEARQLESKILNL